jgi:C-type mannose receptor
VRCYQYFDTVQDWNTASTSCINNNGWLVTIHNLEENNYLYYNSIQSSSYWIGYNDVAAEGTFVWANGDSSIYTNWNSGEPNNYENNQDCTTLGGNHLSKWDDGGCIYSLYFICETSNRIITGGN